MIWTVLKMMGPIGVLEQVVVGNLLGDAWGERKSPTANARLRYSQVSPGHDLRFFFLFKYYALYCLSPAVFRTRTDPRTGHVGSSWMFSTRALPFFTAFYEMFYINGVKVVPYNIMDLLTPLAIAVWIMDDGNRNTGGGLVLNTQSFTEPDVDRLVSALNACLGINSYRKSDSRGQPIIYVRKADVIIVAAACAHHMCPSTPAPYPFTLL